MRRIDSFRDTVLFSRELALRAATSLEDRLAWIDSDQSLAIKLGLAIKEDLQNGVRLFSPPYSDKKLWLDRESEQRFSDGWYSTSDHSQVFRLRKQDYQWLCAGELVKFVCAYLEGLPEFKSRYQAKCIESPDRIRVDEYGPEWIAFRFLDQIRCRRIFVPGSNGWLCATRAYQFVPFLIGKGNEVRELHWLIYERLPVSDQDQ